jgi:hypothetical protein
VSDGDRLDEELEALGHALRRLPTPMPPEGLVSRVRRLGHLELAEQADERLSSLVLAFFLFFSWTVSLLTFFAVRLVREGTAELLGIARGSALSWSAAYFVAAWISGAAVIVLLGLYRRKEGRLA